MKSIGFNFTTNDLRFCVLDGNPKAPTFIEKGKIDLPRSMNSPDLMIWFESQIMLILDKFKPDLVGHKISIKITKLDQVRNSCYPQAILNLVCAKQQRLIKDYTPMILKPKNFGLDKSIDLFEYLDSMMGLHPPYWDKGTKESALIAWLILRKES